MLLGLTSLSCGRSPSTDSALKERINAVNDPARLGLPVDWSYDPDIFPASSESSVNVWSGNWWPLSQGGTVQAMRKYDRAARSDTRAGDWEQNTSDVSGGVSWAGHCNGLAGAGIHEKRPKKPVTYKGVNFSVSDIEALLVEKWQGTNEVTLVGKRCQKQPTYDPRGRIIEEECRDFNPAAFHMILGNVLGLQRQPFVLDVEPGEQVWNYPVVAYKTDTTLIDKAEAIRTTGQNANYSFNDEATQFLKASTQIRLATGVSYSYEYVLEGRNDRITGGEWIGASRSQHPDFAWYMRQAKAANPFLDIKVIDAIADLSN